MILGPPRIVLQFELSFLELNGILLWVRARAGKVASKCTS